MSEDKIFIILKRDDDIVTSHVVTSGDISKSSVESFFLPDTPPQGTNDLESPEIIEKGKSEKDENISPYPRKFIEVERAFSQAMLMYRSSVLETIRVSPLLAGVTLSMQIDKIVESLGQRRDDLSSGGIEVYALPNHATASIGRHEERARALVEGAFHFPKISVIGIISSYDAILADLLRVVFKSRPEIIFTSDREVKLSDLVSLGSIDDVRESIINSEIESVIRQSHHEQFSWMEKKFAINLKVNLDVWPDFVELCERRNLLTHTGGIVSAQYIKNCEAHGIKTKVKVGERLKVDLPYFETATDIVSEIGYKLIHTMWRKFAPEEREKADRNLNELGMKLISSGEYSLAEKILDFAVGQKRHHSDLIKRMMVVNLANAAKLAGNKEKCDRALASHDWSATSYQFQICVAAVRNDLEEVKRLMRLGTQVIEISPSDFRDWPVFSDARNDKGIQDVFEEVFGEKLHNKAVKVEMPIPDQRGRADEEGGPKIDDVIH